MTVKSYLQLARAHTLVIETSIALAGGLLATNGEVTPAVIAFAVFGALYHTGGYAQNSVVDWKNGYDKDDPYKEHHPLNRGALSIEQASTFAGICVFLAFTLGLLLAYINQSVVGITVLLAGLVCGILYNYVGKEYSSKFVLVAIAHTTVFIAPYVTLTNNYVDPVFHISVIYVFTWFVFQIAISGEVAGIKQDEEENILRKLGTYIHQEHIRFTSQVRHFAVSVKAITVISGILIFVALDGHAIYLSGYIALSLIMIVQVVSLLSDGLYNREKRMREIGEIEAFTLILFIAAISPAVGYTLSIIIIVACVISVSLISKYIWGTFLTPKV